MRVLLPLLIVALLAPFVDAQGNGNGKGKGKNQIAAIGIAVVMEQDANGDGLPNWGDYISFDVGSATNAFISLNCYQGATWVMAAGGYQPSWPISLRAQSWPEHTAAECLATLFTTTDGTHTDVLATLVIQVAE